MAELRLHWRTMDRWRPMPWFQQEHIPEGTFFEAGFGIFRIFVWATWVRPYR